MRSSGASSAATVARWSDRIITGGVVLLVVLTPLAIGSVLPWAFAIAEVAVFLMVAVWMARLALVPSAQLRPALTKLRGVLAPLALFVLFVVFQLIPLPPVLTRVLSPATYRLYAKTLAEWPGNQPYSYLLSRPPALRPDQVPRVLPSESEVKEGAPIPYARSAQHRGSNGQQPTAQVPGVIATTASLAYASRWRPLSIAPSLTATILLKFLAYLGLFFLVLFYPFGVSRQDEAERRFYRIVLAAILATGLLVACIAILERAFWNGKILWVFAPYDWRGAQLDLLSIRRARGPFVNPDHFGSYLNLILPLALAGLFFRTFLASAGQRNFLRVSCAVIAFVLVSGLLLSLSRAGWVGAMVGVSILSRLLGFLAPERRPAVFRLSRRATAALCAVGFIAVLSTSSLFVGGSATRDANLRLQEMLGENSTLRVRLGIWKGSIAMARDFPLFGIGLGCFQDLSANYRSPPWSPQSVTEAHNDYLELLTEGGLIGSALLLWFFVGAGRLLYRGLKSMPPDRLPIGAALLSGMAVMALQEGFDFNLQIPANALLFALFLAMALRLIGAAHRGEESDSRGSAPTYALPAVAAAAALLLTLVAIGQGKVPYPYGMGSPETPAAARRLIVAHPAVSQTHLLMVETLGDRVPPAQATQELAIAVWLDPTNPYSRDAYARSLVLSKQRSQAMAEVTQSVFASPSLATHFYLRPRLIPWLAPDERAAVESGLTMAVAHNFKGAVWQLGGFYDALHSYLKEAQLFAHAAAGERARETRAELLLNAGLAYSQANERENAEAALKEAALLDPSNPKPYEYLGTKVFAARKDLASAKSVISGGIAKGADPFALFLALAQASESCGDTAGVESALLKALDIQPSDFETVWRLASLYKRQSRFDQAAQWMRRATEIRPQSADAFYELGLAEEAGYHYFEAERDFGAALRFAPQNAEIRSHYTALKRKAAGAPEEGADPSAR